MRTRQLAVASITILAAGLAPVAQAQGRMPAYEPQQRQRTALDTCGKNEVMREAMCVRKCEADFRMDFSAKTPRCVGLKADAKYTPPVPNYRPPAANPNAKPVPGA